ncbi:MAG: DUF4430 domain-containing protein [Parcubacteria group bacterium]|nr:DUF4430 domain-containing protein [Parcubacteria group bacterium]
MNRKRIFFTIFGILLIVLFVWGFSYKSFTQKFKLTVSEEKYQNDIFLSSQTATTSKKIKTVSESIAENLIEIDFLIGEKIYTANILAGDTVYDAMNNLALIDDFSFKAKNYSGLGYFVEEINGIKNVDGFYWTLYINNKYSTVGVSQHKLVSDDSVWWKYEKK